MGGRRGHLRNMEIDIGTCVGIEAGGVEGSMERAATRACSIALQYARSEPVLWPAPVLTGTGWWGTQW